MPYSIPDHFTLSGISFKRRQSDESGKIVCFHWETNIPYNNPKTNIDTHFDGHWFTSVAFIDQFIGDWRTVGVEHAYRQITVGLFKLLIQCNDLSKDYPTEFPA